MSVLLRWMEKRSVLSIQRSMQLGPDGLPLERGGRGGEGGGEEKRRGRRRGGQRAFDAFLKGEKEVAELVSEKEAADEEARMEKKRYKSKIHVEAEMHLAAAQQLGLGLDNMHVATLVLLREFGFLKDDGHDRSGHPRFALVDDPVNVPEPAYADGSVAFADGAL
jgi:hypothetical protein